MKRIFESEDSNFSFNRIIINQMQTGINVICDDEYADTGDIFLNKEQAIEMANAILKHYNS